MRIPAKYILQLIGISLSLAACSENENPLPDDDIILSFENCLTATSNTRLEILTWNVEKFPLKDENTITELSRIIETLDADLVALQEITSSSAFDKLTGSLPGWEGEIAVSGNLNLAFIYKTSEITVVNPIYAILENDGYAFPRPPAVLEISNDQTGQLKIINIHLKCCDGEENTARRQDAGQKLKDFMDQNWPDDPAILLGDFNDLIVSDPKFSPFRNFILDSLNYLFTDMDIALGSESSWSYPGWPSHIDHILITNELFDRVQETETLALDICDRNYVQVISDHRPVMLQLGGL